MDALVTDTHDRAALAGLRGLGRARIPALALSPRRLGAGYLSRHASRRLAGPDAIADPAGFSSWVESIIDERGEQIVYPGREEAIDALLAADSPRMRRLLPYASLDGLARVRNKRHLPALAEEAGLTTPKTMFTGRLGDLRSAKPDRPFVIKSALPSSEMGRPLVISSQADCDRLLADCDRDTEVLVQEHHRGTLAAVALVLDHDGKVAARFQQRTSATWPPNMGVSAIAQSVAPDDALIERIARMLRSASFRGLAQVQLLESAGAPVVIDINPRFYGSLPLALRAGVNLPAIWHATAHGQTGLAPPDYEVGIVFRWLEARLFSLARRAGAVGGKPSADVGAVWASDDPIASLAAVATTVQAGVTKRLRRIGSG